ncbi:MAG: carboxypeptidase regulatory-like domain-containing protein, partial [Acidobacteriota bacterium]
MRNLFSVIAISLLLGLSVTNGFAQQTGSVSGQVQDSLGNIVPGAKVTITDSTGKEKTVTTNKQGEYAFSSLIAGTYTVRVLAPKFAPYENSEVLVAGAQKVELAIALTVEGVTEQVEVSNAGQVDNDPNNNANATVLTGKDIEALPDDPDELEAALQALAGPSAGPNGGQIFIDGFTGGRLPPRDSIREIRINQNPFSAEFDRLGFGRVEILTKPGSDKWRGSMQFNFNDESLNSRNPFAVNRAPSQTRNYGGNISGPIKKGKSSFFLDINNRELDNGSLINAIVLDQSLASVPYTRELTIPSRRFSMGPRVDYAINDKHTLVVRYGFTRATSENQGVGDLSLPSRAFDTTNTEHEFRLTETAIINSKTVNETRFSFQNNNREQTGDNTIPTINVAAAFVGGGSQVGLSFNKNRQWELQNYTTTSFGKSNQHTVKFGARLRGVSIKDSTSSNFGGSYTFISLTNFRDAIARTATPVQFSITAGNPLAKVDQIDAGLFFTDDWRLSPALTLSAGLRYETQSNISDAANFAPRLSFAWSPGAGGAKQPKTVIRGGAGVFYDRFNESFTLQANRFDGVQQLNYVVSINDTDPVRRAAAIALLTQPVFTYNGVTGSPTVAQIRAALPGSSTIQRVSPVLQAPFTTQATIGVERQLPGRTTLTGFYVYSRTLHVLRTRNVNAPVCASPTNCVGAVRPNPTLGNINSVESSGTAETNQLIL